MSEENFDHSKIISNGWRQGSCLVVNNGDFQDKNNNSLKEGLYVVISQDCDVVNHDLNKEPIVELLFMSEIKKEDGSLTNGKNPRKLHFQLQVNGNIKCLECVIHDKFFLPRQYLAGVVPDNNFFVKDEELAALIKWVANRYTRSAFPDAFNQRVKSIIGEIKAILKAHGGKTLGLFVRLNTYNELDSSEKYKLILNILFYPKYSDGSFVEEFDSCVDEIAQQFLEVEGVEVVQAQRLSIDDLSHYEFLKLKKWDFDYISYSVGADGETL